MILDPRSESQSESGSSAYWTIGDVQRAISAANLGHYASLLLWHVLEHSHDTGCPLDGAALAETWGIHRNRVNEARRWLVRAGIFAEVARGVVFNPKFEEWVQPDGITPLLSGRLLAYSKASPARKPRRKNQEIATPNCFKPQHQTVAIATPNCCDPQRQTVSNPPPQRQTVSPQHQTVASHAIERAPARAELPAAFNSSSLDGENSKQAGGIAPRAREAPSSPPGCPVPDETWVIAPGLNELPRAEALAVLDEVWRVGARSRSLCREWWAAQGRFPAKAWRYALAKLNRRGTVPRKVTLLADVAAEWKPEVIPGPALPPYLPPSTREEIEEHEQRMANGMAWSKGRRGPARHGTSPSDLKEFEVRFNAGVAEKERNGAGPDRYAGQSIYD